MHEDSAGRGDGALEQIDEETQRRVVEAWMGPAAGWEALVAPDIVYTSPLHGRLAGRDAVIAAVGRIDESLGGYRREVKAVVADGPFLALRYEVRGVHDREYGGIPPTGREIETRGIAIFRMRDGLAVEGWNMLDQHRRHLQMQGEGAPATPGEAPSPGNDAACPPPTRSEMTDLVREFFARVWAPDASPGGVVADHVVYHSPAGTALVGVEELARLNAEWRATFPDQRLIPGEILVSGDHAATWYTATATDLGGFAGRPPTGEAVVFDGHLMFRADCGRIVEIWSTLDTAGIIRQLAGGAW